MISSVFDGINSEQWSCCTILFMATFAPFLTPTGPTTGNSNHSVEVMSYLSGLDNENREAATMPSPQPLSDVSSTIQPRLRSQYPLHSPELHVEYILVASFHIDQGPVMEHQYPNAISGDEHMLAELMLPDQTHVRSQDWTIFFLHKDGGVEEEAEYDDGTQEDVQNQEQGVEPEYQTPGRTEETDEEDYDDLEGPPLMYVLNLVNTKQDTTAKRYVHAPFPDLALIALQGCNCEIYGYLHKTFFSPHIQGMTLLQYANSVLKVQADSSSRS